MRATAQQQAAPTPAVSDAAGGLFPDSLLVADGADEMAEKDAARLKGLGVLAFGVLPSLWASSVGVPGAFESKEGGKRNKNKKEKGRPARKRR